MSQSTSDDIIKTVSQRPISFDYYTALKSYGVAMLVLWVLMGVVVDWIGDLEDLSPDYFIPLFVILSLPSLYIGIKFGVYYGRFERIIYFEDTELYVKYMIEEFYKLKYLLISSDHDILSFTKEEKNKKTERVLVTVNKDTKHLKFDIKVVTYFDITSRVKKAISR